MCIYKKNTYAFKMVNKKYAKGKKKKQKPLRAKIISSEETFVCPKFKGM